MLKTNLVYYIRFILEVGAENMTYKLYKICSMTLFFVIALVFLLRHHIENQGIILAILVLLSLFSLYLNILAFIFMVELNVKKNRLRTFFCLLTSIILLLCALAPSVIAYYSLSESGNIILTANKAEILEIESFTPNRPYNKDSAKIYFRKTGVQVEYIDTFGSKIIYSPDVIDKVNYNNFKTYHHLKLNLIKVKNTLFCYMLIIFFSLIVLLVGILLSKKIKSTEKSRIRS